MEQKYEGNAWKVWSKSMKGMHGQNLKHKQEAINPLFCGRVFVEVFSSVGMRDALTEYKKNYLISSIGMSSY